MLIFKELRGHGNRYREIKGPMWHRAVNYRIEHRPHDVSGLSGLPGLFVVCLHGDTPQRYAYTRKHKGRNTEDPTEGRDTEILILIMRGGGGGEGRGKGPLATRNFDTRFLFCSFFLYWVLMPIVRETTKLFIRPKCIVLFRSSKLWHV